MSYRVRPLSRRICFTGVAGLGIAAILAGIFSDPNGPRTATLAVLSAALLGLVVLAVRGWRSATLLASGPQVTIRGLATTTSLRWPAIDRFVVETRADRLLGLPIQIRRRVLGVQLRDGQTRWFPDFSCRPAGDGASWVDTCAAELNELCATASAAQDGQLDRDGRTGTGGTGALRRRSSPGSAGPA